MSQADGPELSTVLVLPAWYPTAERPLAGIFVRDHARAAAAQGHRVVVVVDEGPSAGVRGLFSLTEDRDGELRVLRLAYRPRTGTVAFLPGLLAVARRLAREGTPVEVLHAHVHWMAWIATIAGALLRRPVVITEHSTEWPRDTITRGALRRARIAFRRAALVCPVNEELQRAIERHGIHARFRIVPNAVDTSVFTRSGGQPGACAARQRGFPRGEERPRVPPTCLCPDRGAAAHANSGADRRRAAHGQPEAARGRARGGRAGSLHRVGGARGSRGGAACC